MDEMLHNASYFIVQKSKSSHTIKLLERRKSLYKLLFISQTLGTSEHTKFIFRLKLLLETGYFLILNAMLLE